MKAALLKPTKAEASIILTVASVPSGWAWGMAFSDEPAIWIPAVVTISLACVVGLVLAKRSVKERQLAGNQRRLPFLALTMSILAVGFMLLSWAFVLMLSGGDLVGLSRDMDMLD